jgi:hypothetical protein
VCNRPIRLSQATRNRIVRAVALRKIFRARNFLGKNRRHVEMPMD